MAMAEAVEGTGEFRPFLTFLVRDETFALPLEGVREVIRLPEIATVPLAPASLRGIANLRGVVLPVADLRRLLRWDSAAPTEATRVLVVSADSVFGLVVDRIGALVSVPPDRIEAREADEAADAAMASGLIRGEGEAPVPILDPIRLLRRDFTRPRAAQAPGVAGSAAPAVSPAEALPGDDRRVLVSVISNGQEYALPIEAVEEVVPMPDQVTVMPHADGRIIGVADQRRGLMPLLSLRALLGWPEAERDDRSRVAVVRLDGAALLGLVVDRSGEILRVAETLLHRVPSLLTRGGNLEIGAICRLEEGRRLVSVLSPENLFRHDAVRRAVEAGGGEDGTDMAQSGSGAAERDTEEFVVFHLAGEEYGVSIAEVEEVLLLEGLTRVPKAPAFLEGIMNLRGAVLPVLDQRRRFALPPVDRTGRERVIVHTVDGVRAGFIVDSIAQVLRVPATAVAPAPDLSQTGAPMVSRVVNLTEQGRLVLVLDVGRLLDREETGELGDLGKAG
jgi:purine-binding chemotaxis protein CheW